MAISCAIVTVGCSSDGGTAVDAIELAVLPATVSIAQGDTSSVTATLIRAGSFSGGVDLRVVGAPPGVTLDLSNDQITGSVTSAKVRISVSPVTSPGLYTIELRGTAAGLNGAVATFTLQITEWPPECPLGIDLCSQWAISARASSEYSSPAWAANQAVGKPNVTGCADDPSAWASLGLDTVEWLELTFPVEVRPSEIQVYENYGGGSIVSVQVKDAAGAYHTVHTAQPQTATCPRVLLIPITGISSAISVVRVNIDQRTVRDWNEIDAVRLIGRK